MLTAIANLLHGDYHPRKQNLCTYLTQLGRGKKHSQKYCHTLAKFKHVHPTGVANLRKVQTMLIWNIISTWVPPWEARALPTPSITYAKTFEFFTSARVADCRACRLPLQAGLHSVGCLTGVGTAHPSCCQTSDKELDVIFCNYILADSVATLCL